MRKASELLTIRLKKALEPHGAVLDFCRKSGFSRSAVETWRDGERSPRINDLEKIAEALDMEPWQLIKPESVEESQAAAKAKEEAQALAEIKAKLETLTATKDLSLRLQRILEGLKRMEAQEPEMLQTVEALVFPAKDVERVELKPKATEKPGQRNK